ncbi:helix-turn-helix domain-containing protein [Croceibacterium ferulae]|uniref:AlbA family DNA-binding domain-containing protein n=1 Tax=Croceibacterium ferulae TaxID=1854641 RepID=UPI000EB2440C|nr:ATP-binding protein [Croceibacterium ferulae]
MTKVRARNIETWEVALIKALLMRKQHTKDQIISLFSRPDRTINPYRLSEIAKGEAFAEVSEAEEVQVSTYLKGFGKTEDPRRAFQEASPLHPVNLRLLLSVREGTDQLVIEETDRLECKESLNFGSKAAYARAIAAFANARGGMLLFGVRDADKKVVGINSGKLKGYDPARLNQYLMSVLTPVPLWQKEEVEIAGKTVGVIFVPQATERPLICTKDDGSDLREGDIYFRYPGENRRIKHAELAAIINEKKQEAGREWGSILRRIDRAGIENVALLNVETGLVEGRSGRFLIDEALIPKLQFISRGHFSEDQGAPALRLLGDVEAMQGATVDVTAEVVDHVHVNDDVLIEAFVTRSPVAQPRLFIEHLAYTTKLWLPVFAFVRMVGLTDEAAAALVKAQKGAKPNMVKRQEGRIVSRSVPLGAAKPASAEPTRSSIISKTLAEPATEEDSRVFSKAVRTLGVGEVDADYLLPLLHHCWHTFHDQGSRLSIQYAIAHVDVILHKQEAA